MEARTSRPVKRPSRRPKSERAQSAAKGANKYLTTLDQHEVTTGRAVLLHGDTNAGKTVLAIHKAPRPLLALDCDTGLDSVYGTNRDKSIHIWGPAAGQIELDWEAMDAFRNYVLAGDWEMDYKVIVVDNVTAGQKPVIESVIDDEMERMDEDKRALRDRTAVTQQNWGSVYRRMDRWIRDIKSAKRLGVHVIFTAGTREWLDENAGYSRMMPNLEGAERNQIATHMDAVGWLESDENGRRLYLAPQGAFVTKVRLPVAKHGNVPTEIEDPDFNKMIQAVQGLADEKPKRKTRRTSK